MKYPTRFGIAATTILTLGLAACGSDTEPTVTETVTASPTTTEQTQPLPEEVTRITDALDTLEADHTTPEETEPGELSGADRAFDLNIVDYSAGINLFTTEDDLNTWQEASDDFGGISVTFDTTAVSLNSDEGRDASLALAPQLAAELGGVAHTGGEEPDYTPSGETNEEASAPYVVECLEGTPGPALWSDGTMANAEECQDPEYAKAEGDATRQYWEDNPHLLPENQTGNESGVDWQNKDTNSDWSDAEVDAYIACFEKYDYNDYAAHNCWPLDARSRSRPPNVAAEREASQHQILLHQTPKRNHRSCPSHEPPQPPKPSTSARRMTPSSSGASSPPPSSSLLVVSPSTPWPRPSTTKTCSGESPPRSSPPPVSSASCYPASAPQSTESN